MGLSDEVRRLEEENSQLKEALAMMVRALQDAMPLLRDPLPPTPVPSAHMTQPAPVPAPPPPQPDTTVPPSMAPQNDGAYRVDPTQFVGPAGNYEY